MDISTKIGKIKFKNPVMVASGTFGYADEYKDLIDLSLLGGIITKSISVEKKQGNKSPRLWETTAGMLNAIGLQNDGLDDFLTNKIPLLKNIKTEIIASIAGSTIDEYALLAQKIKNSVIAGLEINISCPNINKPGKKNRTKNRLFAQDAKMTAAVVKAVKQNTGKTVIVKLSPDVTSIAEIAIAAEESGADAISAINTTKAMAVNAHTQTVRLGNITGGLSGPAIKPIALRAVWEIAQSVSIPIIGIGGIMTAEDAIEFLLCGASAVQVGTANFVSPQAPIAIIKGIQNYLKEKKLTKLKDIIGKLQVVL